MNIYYFIHKKYWKIKCIICVAEMKIHVVHVSYKYVKKYLIHYVFNCNIYFSNLFYNNFSFNNFKSRTKYLVGALFSGIFWGFLKQDVKYEFLYKHKLLKYVHLITFEWGSIIIAILGMQCYIITKKDGQRQIKDSLYMLSM